MELIRSSLQVMIAKPHVDEKLALLVQKAIPLKSCGALVYVIGSLGGRLNYSSALHPVLKVEMLPLAQCGIRVARWCIASVHNKHLYWSRTAFLT